MESLTLSQHPADYSSPCSGCSAGHSAGHCRAQSLCHHHGKPHSLIHTVSTKQERREGNCRTSLIPIFRLCSIVAIVFQKTQTLVCFVLRQKSVLDAKSDMQIDT